MVIKLPMPPSFMLTLWWNNYAFIEKYLTETPGYYSTGDAGFLDENGYLHVMTWTDDVINCAGHRLSCGWIEEVVNSHPLVVESAVIGLFDDLKTEIPFVFLILADQTETKISEWKILQEVNELVKHEIGGISSLGGGIIL